MLRVQKVDDLFYQSAVKLSSRQQLHPDAEKFIVEEAEKLPANSIFEITLLIGEQTFRANEVTLRIRQHFEAKMETESFQVKNTIRIGLRSLLIGFVFLVIMYLLTTIVKSLLPQNALMITLREFFIILAWVALWRPADLLLYEWWPHKRKAKLFERLMESHVQVLIQ